MVVTATYNNGLSSKVIDYSVSYSSLTTLGSVELTIEYTVGEVTASTTITINVSECPINTIPTISSTVRYTGSELTPNWSNYIPDQLDISGEASATDVGTYTAIFTPKEGYTWSDGSNDPKEVTWSIDRAIIQSEPYQSAVLEYTGSTLSPTWSNYDPAKLTISGTTSAADVGVYTTIFTPTSNYQWSDGSVEGKEVSWMIAQSVELIDLPVQTNTLRYNSSSQSPTWSNDTLEHCTVEGPQSSINAGTFTLTLTPLEGYAWSDDRSTSAKTVEWVILRYNLIIVPTQSNTLTYTGSKLTPTWNNYNTDQYEVSGATSAINAGTYTAIFTPKSPNYQWSDGSVEGKNVTWKIGRATLSATYPSQSGTLTYSNEWLEPTWSNYNPNQLIISGTTSAAEAGTYTAIFTPTSNYQWSGGSVSGVSRTWTIQKLKLTIPSQSGTLTYDGSWQYPEWNYYNPEYMTWTNEDSQMDAGSYTATFSLDNTTSTQWNTTSSVTSNKSVTWRIGRATVTSTPYQAYELTYDGTTQEPTWYDWYQDELTLSGTTSGINAGSYSARFTPTSNYQWSGGSTSYKTITWTIGKARATLNVYYLDRRRYNVQTGVRVTLISTGSTICPCYAVDMWSTNTIDTLEFYIESNVPVSASISSTNYAKFGFQDNTTGGTILRDTGSYVKYTQQINMYNQYVNYCSKSSTTIAIEPEATLTFKTTGSNTELATVVVKFTTPIYVPRQDSSGRFLEGTIELKGDTPTWVMNRLSKEATNWMSSGDVWWIIDGSNTLGAASEYTAWMIVGFYSSNAPSATTGIFMVFLGKITGSSRYATYNPTNVAPYASSIAGVATTGWQYSKARLTTIGSSKTNATSAPSTTISSPVSGSLMASFNSNFRTYLKPINLTTTQISSSSLKSINHTDYLPPVTSSNLVTIKNSSSDNNDASSRYGSQLFNNRYLNESSSMTLGYFDRSLVGSVSNPQVQYIKGSSYNRADPVSNSYNLYGYVFMIRI